MIAQDQDSRLDGAGNDLDRMRLWARIVELERGGSGHREGRISGRVD
jgi:hypothetical protein